LHRKQSGRSFWSLLRQV